MPVGRGGISLRMAGCRSLRLQTLEQASPILRCALSLWVWDEQGGKHGASRGCGLGNIPGSRLEAEPGSAVPLSSSVAQSRKLSITALARLPHTLPGQPQLPPGLGVWDKAGDRRTWNDPVGCCLKREGVLDLVLGNTRFCLRGMRELYS